MQLLDAISEAEVNPHFAETDHVSPPPHVRAVLARYAAKFPRIPLLSIDDPIFGGWAKAQPYHFADGGIFDQIYKPTN